MTNYNDALVLYNSGVIYGGVVAADWQIDIHDTVGAIGSPLTADVEFKDASIVWALDGPGSAEITLPEDSTGSVWLSGRRRVVISRNGTRYFSGYLNNVRASSAGRPHFTQYDVSALGLASILDFRVVHGDFSNISTVGTTIAWNLINHANSQESMGFSLGTVTGTATSLTRHFCDGDVIAEMVKEIAERDTGGFDWEIDPQGAFNAWVGSRGTDKTGSINFTFNKRIGWTEEAETSDVVTYTTALGKDPDGPCGPPASVQNIALSGYPRREVVIEGERFDAAELANVALDEIKARQRARVRSEATMFVDDVPWTIGPTGVWLGDLITMVTNTPFGGSQTMKCIEVKVSLERGATEWWTYTFERN